MLSQAVGWRRRVSGATGAQGGTNPPAVLQHLQISVSPRREHHPNISTFRCLRQGPASTRYSTRTKHYSDRVVSSTGCFFQLVPPRKVLSMELVPPNSKKMTKYTGPTQDTEDDRVFNKQFLLIKTNCWSCSFSCYRAFSLIGMVREWTAPQRTFLVEKKLQCHKRLTSSSVMLIVWLTRSTTTSRTWWEEPWGRWKKGLKPASP